MAVRRKFDVEFKEKVLQYAEEHSGEQAARFFNVDPRRVRYWKKQKGELQRADKNKARLDGGGRKKVSVELETRLAEWIHMMRDGQNHVSRKMITKKALEIYSSVADGEKGFVASRGWLHRFLQRNALSLHQRSAVTQKDPVITKALKQLRQRGQEGSITAPLDEEEDQELLHTDLSVNTDEDGEDGEEDVQKLNASDDQQERILSPDQKHSRSPHTEDEQRDLLSCHGEDLLQGWDQTDVRKTPLASVPVEVEDEEQKLGSLGVRRKFDVEFKEKVLQYAEEHSGEQAARFFNVDPRRVRYWKKQKGELQRAEKSRARLVGGGRKKVSTELETRLAEWVWTMSDRKKRVSRKMITRKALAIYSSVADGEKGFVASRGWLHRFLQRNALSLHQRSAVTQKDPVQLTEELVSFVGYVSHIVSSKKILDRDIIAMNETAVWFDLNPPTAAAGQKSVPLKDMRHGRNHLTVVLAAKADGTKLEPYIVFKGKSVQLEMTAAVMASSVNGWMDDSLTAGWLQSVLGKRSSTPRLLVWDSYRCHISAATKEELESGYNIDTAVIPPGCAKYIQASDLMWIQPFKRSLQEAYTQWVSGGAGRGLTNEDPPHRQLVEWVVSAWDKLDDETIRTSFRVCGLALKSDGSEDHLIHCFKEGQPCSSGREALKQLRQRGQEGSITAPLDEEEDQELFCNELVVVGGEEDSEDGEEDSPTDDQQLNGSYEESSEQQESSQSLDEEDTKPLRIKEEQEEEELQGWEEVSVTFVPFVQAAVKSEDHEETRVVKTEDSSAPETDDRGNWNVQQLLVMKEEMNPSLDEEDIKPLLMKQEQEILCCSLEGEQLQGCKVARIASVPFEPVSVQSEDDGEKPRYLRLLQTEQMETEADGGPEPVRNSDPDRQPVIKVEIEEETFSIPSLQ
ncbi:Pogo transposable element with KRAB domain [Xyrichtys novacula]|nr:Pogo transposable element with KRAB domain [Xyrichtys novacula]